MKYDTFPLAMPPDLLGEVRKTAKETGLSMADAMRQSIKLGLPELREKLGLTSEFKPFTAEETKLAYGTSNPEFDALERHCANLNTPVSRFEE